MEFKIFRKTVIDKVTSIIKNLKKFHPKFIKKALNLLDWHHESIIKNKIIHSKKSHDNNPEFVKRPRGYVYWTDFGENVGSEFNGNHFSVVIYDSYYTSIIVPLSSKKENEAKWKKNNNLVVDIGKIEQIPNNETEAYAMINQIKTVSKKRLSSYTNNGNRLKLKLNDDQLDIIDDAIKKHLIK